jgi:hypothetical protein
MTEAEFEVTGFQPRAKGGFRSDKRKKHNYRAKRKTRFIFLV